MDTNVRPESMARIQTVEQAEAFIAEQVAAVREQVGDKKVLLALSGGVDSSVVAALLIKAIGKQLVCVHVNHGLMRKNESEDVIKMFKEGGYSVYLHLNELPNCKAIARSLNRYIEEGRFISPKVIAQYGDTPTRNFYTIINAEENLPLYKMLSVIAEEDKYGMIKQVLSPDYGDFVVTPKEVDTVVENIAEIIANGINIALHEGITLDDIDRYK